MNDSKQNDASNTGEGDTTELPFQVVFAYSFLAIPAAAIGLPLAVYLPPFYANELGLGLATVGFIFTITKLWDVVTDPVMGFIIDRYPSRWGRYKHWILLSTPILMCSAWFIFMPSIETHSSAYLLGWLIILYVGYTFLTIAHNAWGTDLATSYHARSRLFGWREIIVILGVVVVLALPAAIEVSGGDTSQKIASMGWFVIILLPIAATLIVKIVPEKAAHMKPNLSLAEALKLLLSLPPLKKLLIADFIASIGFGAVAVTYIFVATWVFDFGARASLLLLAYFLAGLLAIPIWMRVSYKFGKHKTLIIAMFYAGLVLFGFVVSAHLSSTVGFILATVMFGASFGVPPMMVRSMMSDISDQYELESGTQRASVLFAYLTTTSKIGGALSVSLIYFILELVGFDPAADVNSDAAISGLLWTYVLFPSALFVLASLVLSNYPLDEEAHGQIRASLGNR